MSTELSKKLCCCVPQQCLSYSWALQNCPEFLHLHISGWNLCANSGIVETVKFFESVDVTMGLGETPPGSNQAYWSTLFGSVSINGSDCPDISFSADLICHVNPTRWRLRMFAMCAEQFAWDSRVSIDYLRVGGGCPRGVYEFLTMYDIHNTYRCDEEHQLIPCHPDYFSCVTPTLEVT